MPAPLDYFTQKSPRSDIMDNAFHFDLDFPQMDETLTSSIDSSRAQDLEASFCRNFACCGLVLENLHDLLQHFEECHVRLEAEESSLNPLYEEEFSTSSESDTTSTPPYVTDQASFLSLESLLQSDITSMSDIYSEDNSGPNENYYSAVDNAIIKSPRTKNSHKHVTPVSSKRKITIQPREMSLTSTSQPDEYPHLSVLLSSTLLSSADSFSQDEEQLPLNDSKKHKPCPLFEKPYKCLVPGCDKTYKNPNGLKYHTQHGHCTNSGQKKKDTPIVKPYHCAYPDCGKSYKNLNGLKYHIEHTHVVAIPTEASSISQ
ncbi:Transcriptional regulator of ribosomal biogenesis proteins [Basidiobolus ranarum]|uniref:Transcriptional regulator of ribosomal biogenesis proteins n=1 Tax=Basidiobolus ranarum TaxID=34480 RepID=A0ABR2VSK6_9FUNG